MLSIIVAVAQNDVIGGDNKLLWHISNDLKRFKEITSGHTMIMGRKTFESLPGVLPNRHHIILTRDKNYTIDNPNVEVIHSIEEIIHKFKFASEEAFIIGGGEIYKQLIHSVDRIYLTKIFKDFEGDTKFPTINFDDWTISFKSEIFTDPNNLIQYEFIDLLKS